MIDFLVNLALNLAPKTHQKSTQEVPKIDKKGIENMMQVGLEFGSLLGRILVDSGAKLGGKLDPSWHQNPEKRGPKTMSKIVHKNHSEKSMQPEAPGCSEPLLGSLKRLDADIQSLYTVGQASKDYFFHWAPKARWRI